MCELHSLTDLPHDRKIVLIAIRLCSDSRREIEGVFSQLLNKNLEYYTDWTTLELKLVVRAPHDEVFPESVTVIMKIKFP